MPNKYPILLELEISNQCNSQCRECVRSKGSDIIKKLIATPNYWTVDDIITYFPDDLIANVQIIEFIGELGDPLMNPNFLNILQYIHSKNPKLRFTISTNGSLRDIEFWTTFGNISKDMKLEVVFAIDGLSDTNHIYRKGCNFDKIIRNAKIFIQQGGNATWQFIKFEHNSHQVKDAKSLAMSLGFNRFFIVPNELIMNRNHDKISNSIHKLKLKIIKQKYRAELFEVNKQCGVCNNNVSITNNFEVFTCGLLYFDTTYYHNKIKITETNSIVDIFNSEEYQKIKEALIIGTNVDNCECLLHYLKHIDYDINTILNPDFDKINSFSQELSSGAIFDMIDH